MRTLLWAGAAFAAGSLPTARLVTKALTGGSIDELGDGKPGSSNVARSVGWLPGTVVLAVDVAKAYAPAAAARERGAGDVATAAVGMGAMLGHIAIVGGRGVACTLGALLAADQKAMALCIVPLLAGSAAGHNAESVTLTALSLPAVSFAVHRRPARALGVLALITLMMVVRLRGSAGAGWPTTPEVWRNRFWLDRDERGS